MSVEPPGTASDGPVTVERSITVKEEGVIVELTARAEAPTTVRVSDELPATVGPNEVGFHPDHAPDEGEATDELVTVEGSVAPDAPLTAVYGAYLDTSGVDPDGLDASGLRVDADPAARPDASSPSGLRGYVSGLFGGGRSDEEPETDAPTTASGADADSLEGSDVAVEESDDASETLDIEAAEAATEAGAVENVPDDIELVDDVDDADEPEPTAVEPAIVAVPDDEPETADSTAATPADTNHTDELDADAEADADDDPDTMSDTTTVDDGEEQGAVTDAATDGNESVAAALAAELEAGKVDEATRETLARELGAELSGSDSARLDHVQRKVDDLAAYTEALEELLDEEGRPAAVVADLREEIGEVRAATGDLRADLDRTEAELESVVDEEISRLEAGFDEAAADRNAIRDELKSTASELSTAREKLGDEVATLRDDLTAELERVERQAREGRRDIAADVEEFEAVAERVRSLQQALSSAFGGVEVDEPAADDTTNTSSDAAPDTEPDVDADDDGGDGDDIESRIREIETDED